METGKFGHDLGRILLCLYEFSLDLRLKVITACKNLGSRRRKASIGVFDIRGISSYPNSSQNFGLLRISQFAHGMVSRPVNGSHTNP
jgi:hypothetical protein